MNRGRQFLGLGAAMGASLASWPATVRAQDTLDSGDTAWVLTSTALVLFMTIPGPALFYGGLVRTKNVLSVLMQCFVLMALVTVIWLVAGYSLAFDATGMTAHTVNLNSFIGTLNKAFLHGVAPDALRNTIPEVLFVIFQLTFAWTLVGTYVSLKVAGIVGLRVDADDEEAGLDLTQHTERGYDL